MTSFTIRIPDELNSWLEAQATKNNRSKAAEVAHILEQAMKPVRYEYHHPSGEVKRQINEAAGDGWRLVAIAPDYNAVFERAKDE